MCWDDQQPYSSYRCFPRFPSICFASLLKAIEMKALPSFPLSTSSTYLKNVHMFYRLFFLNYHLLLLHDHTGHTQDKIRETGAPSCIKSDFPHPKGQWLYSTKVNTEATNLLKMKFCKVIKN